MLGKSRIRIALSMAVFIILSTVTPVFAAEQCNEGDIVFCYDFEDNTTQDWVPRGSSVLSIESDDAHDSQYSLITTGRTDAWNGPSLNMIGKLKKGAVYRISAFVKLGEMPDSERSVKITMEEKPSAENSSTGWVTVGSRNMSDTEWTEITGTYAFNLDMSGQILYVESSGTTDIILIDDVTIEMTTPPAVKPITGIENDIPSLREHYTDSFKIGAAIEPNQILMENNDALLKKHYNCLVAENVMKPKSIQPTEGKFNWANADKIAQYAKENDMSLRYHTLVWHQQVPDWFFLDKDGKKMIEQTDPAKQEENKKLLLDRLETHIREVVRRYGKQVDSWDVVNEVIEPGDNNPGGLRNSKWYQITGKEYIKTAFLTTKDELEKIGGTGKLYINDYSTHDPVKRDYLYDLVQELITEGVPIDGVGHQTHVNISRPSVKQMTESIIKFGELGLDNQITELDVSIYEDNTVYNSYNKIPEDLLVRQGYRYKELFEGLKTVEDYISNVVFWGIADDHTWLNSRSIKRIDAPFVFDNKQYTKPAFCGIVDSSKLPMRIKEMDIPGGIAYIDGESEFRWDILKPVELVSGEYKAAFKTMWDSNTLYLYADVTDLTVDGNDRVEIFIDTNNGKTDAYESDDSHYVFYRDEREVQDVSYRIVSNDGSYCLEAAVPMRQIGIPGDMIGFDIRFTDGYTGKVISWNDLLNEQEQSTSRFGNGTFTKPYQAIYALCGTPEIDGEMDKIWMDALEFETKTYVQGIQGATAKVKTLWDDQKIYIYAEVTDDLFSDAADNAWEQDSIEIFIDQNNGKTDEYEKDDAQYRVSFKNTQTFGAGASAENIISAAKVVDGGYVVEAAITFDAIQPTNGMFIGFDFQVNNDGNGDGTRDSVVTWNDETGQSYQNTSRLGVLKFINDEALFFTDIYDVAWAQEQIEFLAEKGFLKAVTGKSFRPMDEITRADFLYFLVNTLGLTAETNDNFADVDESAYFYKAVATAKKLGITTGVGENMFKPMDAITRQDAVTLIIRALDSAGKTYESADVSVIQGYIDFSIIADYAVDNIAILVKNGFMQGNGNRLNPLHRLTRAETAVLLYRIYTE